MLSDDDKAETCVEPSDDKGQKSSETPGARKQILPGCPAVEYDECLSAV